MTMTFKELFELEYREQREKGRDQERREQLDNAVSSLRKILRRRKIDPSKWEKHFAKLVSAGQLVDIVAGIASAKDPVAYLKRRFSTRTTPVRRRSTAARA